MPLADVAGGVDIGQVVHSLQIFRFETGPFRDLDQHNGSNLFVVMKSERNIRLTWSCKHAMRAGLTFDLPTDAHQSS